MDAPLLTLQNISFSLGGPPLLLDAALSVHERDRICVVGRNGCGKSTLLKIASGDILPDGGQRFLQPGTRVIYVPQEPTPGDAKTVFDYVAATLPPARHFLARSLITEVGLTPGQDAAALSGGEMRRAALARALAAEPDLLLLDEPTNHLDLPTILWLETALRRLNAAVIFISHDRQFLKNMSRGVVSIYQGQTHRLNEGFEKFENWRDDFLEEAERSAHKLDRQIAREEDWMRYGVTARRKRTMRRVAELGALRKERSELLSRRRGAMSLEARTTLAGGKLAADIEALGKSFGERCLVENLNPKILRGDRIGIIGPNGSGKTTLLKLITGALMPDHGRVALGPSIQPIVINQRRETLDPSRTLVETLTDGKGDMVLCAGQTRHVMGYMKDFLFRPEQARTPVSALSGGERGRLALAKALLTPTNFLILDEPTNDLDLDTLEVLLEWLENYEGTVLLVSHDRDFLDRIVTSTLVAEGEGCWTEYAGGYADIAALSPKLKSPPSRENVTAERKAPSSKPSLHNRKLSYNDQRALDQLPERISQLEEAISGMTAELAQPDLYQKDPTRFSTLTEKLAQSEKALEVAEEQWLTLELKKSALSAPPDA